ncbi:unnamed protein product [Effrenium voratum]|uniref:Uncharacterized protein n=1 Tax=Effrenium voratum TaxID=2562239 RepID=A0AA36MK54_9DINO|nr:unnamed protein product [Effrenium voratum]CAJ1371205.1 unnamed protein product [Effrenium voratum]CAJ1428680.1 unnamed protein product [Effrenium voratum]
MPRPSWVLPATLGVTSLIVALLVTRSRADGEVLKQRPLLLQVLRELSRRFFLVCQDVAAIANTVRAKMEASQMSIAEQTLQEQLLKQCQVFEKLQQIQKEVASSNGLTEEELERMQEQDQDPEVQSYAEGFRAMLEEALQGLSPVLPNVKIPEALTHDTALAWQMEAQDLEAAEALGRVTKPRVALRELGEALTAANKAAWAAVLKGHADLLEGNGAEVYHSAMAIYGRDPAFAQRKLKLEQEHQERMIKLFQPDGTGHVTVKR